MNCYKSVEVAENMMLPAGGNNFAGLLKFVSVENWFYINEWYYMINYLD